MKFMSDNKLPSLLVISDKTLDKTLRIFNNQRVANEYSFD